MKKTKGFLLYLTLAVLLFSTGARQVSAVDIGEFQYELAPGGTAVLTRWLGTAAEPLIPSALEGYAVTGIGEEAFRDNSSLQRIALPKGVTAIGPLAFYNCAALRGLTLPAALVEIGDFAFAYCASLQSVAVPEGTKRIGEYAFGDCAALKAAVIPPSVSQIGPDAFSGAAQGFTLYGGEGSAAQDYARQNGIPFGAPGDAPSPEMTAAVPEEPPGPVSEEANQDDEPAAWTPAPETLSGLWLVTTTYETWHGEDGVEKEWNLTWSSPVLLDFGPDGQGTWTQMHDWGTLSGPASLINGAISATLQANGPSQYEGKIIMDGAEATLEGTMTEESHTDTSMWTKGPWSALKVAEPAELSQYRELKERVAGKDVAALKTRLFELGYFRSDPGTDYYTDKTGEAVAAFEKLNGMTVDGIADPVMQALFYSDLAVPNPE